MRRSGCFWRDGLVHFRLATTTSSGKRCWVIEGEEDCFVHYAETVGEGFQTLEEGSEVEFEIVEDRRGRKDAARVEVVG